MDNKAYVVSIKVSKKSLNFHKSKTLNLKTKEPFLDVRTQILMLHIKIRKFYIDLVWRFCFNLDSYKGFGINRALANHKAN